MWGFTEAFLWIQLVAEGSAIQYNQNNDLVQSKGNASTFEAFLVVFKWGGYGRMVLWERGL